MKIAKKLKAIKTSKTILLADFSIAILLTIVAIIGAFLEKDMSQVAAIAVGWDGQLAVATGFYYWKAKNGSKHAMKLVKELAKEYGIENVVSLAEVILKD